MPKWFPVILVTAWLSSGLSGEILVEFDGKEWNLPEGLAELAEAAVNEGVCFTADANVPAGVALKGLEVDQLLTHPIRFALRGQEGQGAKLDPIPPEKIRASSVILLVCDRSQVTAACMPSEPVSGLPPHSEFMTNDFEGLEKFLEVIRKGVRESGEAKEVPRVVVIARSTTSFGHLVRLLQLVRSAGCKSGLVRVDDEIPSLEFDVLLDPDVVSPVAKVAKAEPSGRILVNIHEDGTLTDGNQNKLDGDEGVLTYVANERKRFEAEGVVPKLHLRGAQDAVFKYSRQVIRGAAKAGVDQVIFAAYKPADIEPKDAPVLRETDISMALPKVPEGLSNAVPPSPAVLEISIDEAGRISAAKEGGMLDTDMAKRDLPLFSLKLVALAKARDAEVKDLGVTIAIHPEAPQQRVIDVLNALAKSGVTRVTFMDPPAKGDEE